MLTSKVSSYSELKNVYEQGHRKVFVEYVKEKWELSEDELINEVHTIIEDEDGILDLEDSKGRLIGCLDTVISDKLIIISTWR